MEIISKIAEMLANMIDCIVIIYFLNKYLEFKGKDQKLTSLYGFIPLFIIANYLSDHMSIQLLLQILIMLTYSITFLKGSKKKKIVVVFAMIMMMSIISLITLQLVSLMMGMNPSVLIQTGSIQRIIVLIITKLLLLFTCYIFLAIYKEDMRLQRNEWILIIIYFISASIISVILLNIVVHANLQQFRQIQMILVTLLLLAITSVSFVLVGKISKDKEFESLNKILGVQLEEQKSSLIKSQLYYDETRKLRHDINRHFVILLDMLKNNQATEVIKIMEELVDSKSDNSIIYIANNNIINSVLNEKVSICNQNNINFEIKVYVAIEKEKELESAIMISNLLDNAIEAQLKLIGENNIILEIFRYQGMYNLIITNNIEKSVLKTNSQFKTNKTKPKQHGIGLRSVKDTVKKFEGNFDCFEKDNQFAVHIMIPS